MLVSGTAGDKRRAALGDIMHSMRGLTTDIVEGVERLILTLRLVVPPVRLCLVKKLMLLQNSSPNAACSGSSPNCRTNGREQGMTHAEMHMPLMVPHNGLS